MQIIFFRYSPRVVELKYVAKDALIIAPKALKAKYDAYADLQAKVIFLEDYTLPEFIKCLKRLEKKVTIESITTLSEEDMDQVGFLADLFLHRKTTFGVNTLFKDKYYMRSVLAGCTDILQPKFELVIDHEQICEFFKKHHLQKAVIKARNLAGTEEIYPITEKELAQLPKHIYNGGYLIEEYVSLKRMLTCDGFAFGSKIQYIFSHEYEDLLLDTLSKNSGYIIRTNHLYWTKRKLLEQVFEKSQKVLATFTDSDEVTPFHFEWFYDEKTESFVFCEVGKRFGGGAIPALIQYGFGVNILEKYWQALTQKNDHQKTENVFILPQKIATSYSPYLQNGEITALPAKEEFDWTKETYFFVDVGKKVTAATAVVQNTFLSIFTSDGEAEYRASLAKLAQLAQKFKYE